MVAQSSDAEVPEFDMEEKGEKLDILLPAQAGTVRVEYASLRAEESEEPGIISKVAIVPAPKARRAAQIPTYPAQARLDLFEHVAYMTQVGAPGYSGRDRLPGHLGTLLYNLESHVTEMYLQTASVANPSYAFHDEGHSTRVSNYLEQLASMHHPEFCLHPVEYFLVMVGAWTHDIGFAQSPRREIHHEQARNLVYQDRSIRAYLANDEIAIEVVARLAYNHSSKVVISSIDDWHAPITKLIPGEGMVQNRLTL